MIMIIIDLQYLAAAGFAYVIRGCAPFTTEVIPSKLPFPSTISHTMIFQVFSPAVARSIEGNYWRVTFIQSKVYNENSEVCGPVSPTIYINYQLYI